MVREVGMFLRCRVPFLPSDGQQIAQGTARRLIQKFDVKKRAYYGNTSMDAEMSLLMANQTLVR
jgi:hypothetical protein